MPALSPACAPPCSRRSPRLQAKHLTRDQYAMNHPAGRIGKRLMLRVSDVMLRCAAGTAGWRKRAGRGLHGGAAQGGAAGCGQSRPKRRLGHRRLRVPAVSRNGYGHSHKWRAGRRPAVEAQRQACARASVACRNGKVPVVQPDALMPEVLVELTGKRCGFGSRSLPRTLPAGPGGTPCWEA